MRSGGDDTTDYLSIFYFPFLCAGGGESILGVLDTTVWRCI